MSQRTPRLFARRLRLVAALCLSTVLFASGVPGDLSGSAGGGIASAQDGPASRCDFDGDGTGDLAVGVPGEDDGRGAVNVQYNKVGFLTVPAILRPHHPAGDSYFHGAKFGSALACGDFNDDGLADLAVGAPHTRTGGDVWIIWGKKGSGLDDGFFNVFRQNNAEVPGAAREDELFGIALASGDFNRDGIDDLAIGDPHERNPSLGYNTGTVVVVYGNKIGLVLEGLRMLWGWHIEEENEVHGQKFGWSLATAPLVSGGGDDLVVGAPQTKVSRTARVGRVYLFRDHGGLVAYQAIDDMAIGVAGGAAPASIQLQTDTWFGHAVAIGDFNGDERLDLAVGSPRRKVAGQDRAGSAMILRGNGTGLDLTGQAGLVQEMLGGTSQTPDAYGWSLAAGNWNEDQFDDLAVGAPFDAVGVNGQPGGTPAGSVYVHYGGPNLLNGAGLTFRQGSGSVPGSPYIDDWFGMSLASVRLGSGNAQYLVIGIPGETLPTVVDNCSKAGAVQLARSWPGIGPVTAAEFLLHQDTGAPHFVSDQRECGSVVNPTEVGFSEPLRRGEFFGWATGQ
jgi:hypothetical protein